MRALAAWTVAGPTTDRITLKALDLRDDQRAALAWTESPAPGVFGPWRLRLRALECQGGCGGTERTLSAGLGEAGAAVSLLPDGSTLVAWRETLERVPNHELSVERRLFLQRFNPAGEPAGAPELVDAFLFSQRLQGGGRHMGPPAIGHWRDGSFVVTWADVREFDVFPGRQASIRARRYHANGWPVGPAATVSTGWREEGLTLSMPPDTGGYVISHITQPRPPELQTLLPLEFWNPLPAEALSGLLPGSFLLGLGICGNLLFAGRAEPGTGRPVYTREYFEYSGQLIGPTATLPELPVGAIALKEVEFLVLRKPAAAGGLRLAQRMDKYGRVIGLPFELPSGPTALLADGSLLVAWVSSDDDGNRLRLQRFVPTNARLSPGLATA